MIQKISRWIISGAMVLSGIGLLSVAAAPTTYAACDGGFLTFKPWYDGLTDASCNIKQPSSGSNGLSTFIWRIVLNIIGIALQVVAYIAAGYLIYGGFRYLTSTGSSDKITAARKTIMNALIGLLISILSVAIVSLVAGNLNL